MPPSIPSPCDHRDCRVVPGVLPAARGGRIARITFEQHDLSTGVFDIVVSNQVLMNIGECTSAIRSCVDALAPGGELIVSLQHPCFENTAAEYDQRGFVQVAECLNAYIIPKTYVSRFTAP
ncbi:MAG: class I SAM-dependent methyltransferase [Thermomicrobiales bacterium]